MSGWTIAILVIVLIILILLLIRYGSGLDFWDYRGGDDDDWDGSCDD